jgi:acyl transferase domain-containing protein/acyl carrier protein
VATACSTSLVTAHMACQSLLGGECDLALAGGVSISTPLRTGYLAQEGDVASADGHTRAFDARAAGAVEGNGCGVVVLKRLADALADGDRVYAVIRGSAVNNDGAGKVGFTAPSVEGQAEAITESLLMAGVEPATIGYVEGHGSGTPLGDPIEVAALTQAFRAGGAGGTGFCALGSVKTNLGHCNAAAGVAGLIKATLALAHRAVPPSLHFETPNPQLGLAESPFYVPTQAVPWAAGETPRRAGVSSFGLGGTNAHLVLEEAPAAETTDAPSRPAQLLVLSARTASALDAAAERLTERLEAEPELDLAALADIAWTLQTGRKPFEHRRMLVARDAAAAVAALRDRERAVSGRREGAGARPVVFLFPGLGDQRVDMARELYATEPAFRATIDHCAEKLAPLLGADLREVMFSAGEAAAERSPAGPDLRAMLRRGGAESAEGAGEDRLRRTLFAQPACFVVEYALARLLISWGIEPQAMIGYSLGEYVAACVSGALALDDALELVAARARWIDELPAGAMLAIPLPEAEVLPALGEGVSLAATNGPHFCVAAGPSAAIDALACRFTAQGVSTIHLRTTHAFHSAMMEPAVAALTAAAQKIAVQPPRIPYLSNVTGSWITADDLADPAYWARHMRSTVRFAEGIGELLAEPERVFLEVGPGATLGTLVKQHPAAAANRIALPTLRRADEGGSDLDLLLASVGRLWIAGAAVDWAAFHNGERRRKVALPTYPFERQRFWVDPPAQAAASAAPADAAPLQAPDLADWFWVPSWREAPLAPVLSAENGRWLIFLDSSGLGARIAARLRGAGCAVFTVEAGSGFEAPGDGAFRIDPARRQDYDALLHAAGGADAPLKVLHLWGLTGGVEPGFAAAQTAGLVSLTLLAQAVSAHGSGPVRLALVADGLHEVSDGDPLHPAKATVLGPLKVIHQEVTRLTCGSVDVVLPAAGSPAEERLIEHLLAELSSVSAASEPAVALRGRRRWVRGFAPVRLEEPSASPLARGGACLIAEAVHGPGMRIAEHLLRTLAARVALVMPPQFPERGSWETWHALPEVPPGQDVIGDAVLRLLALEREIGLDNLLILRGGPEEIAAAVAAARERFGTLQGAFFTGGAAGGGLLQLKTAESLHAALDPLVSGAGALLAALDTLEDVPGDPPFAVLSSTTTAWAGSLGQLDQAAAGSYLDALAARRAADGKARTVAVHWDPYQWGGWLVAGAAGGTSGLAAEQVAATLAVNGVPEARSAEALGRLLASGLPRLAVANRDLPGLIAETDSVTAESLLAQMAPAHTGEKGARPAGLPTAYEPPGDELEEQLAALWQDLFGIAPIGRHDSFLELGGHSLLAIQMVTQIRALLDVELPVTALFEAPTVAELGRAVRRARGEEDAADLEALLALVEGLSPEEAAERLAGMGVG